MAFQSEIKTQRPAVVLLLTILFCCASACNKASDQPKTSDQPASADRRGVAPSPSQAQPVTPSRLQTKAAPAPPKTEEVGEAMVRVFGQSAKIDLTHSPAFLAADFNGDGSEDIAVVTRTNDASLAEINNELANWTLEDPHEVPMPGSKAAEQLIKPKPVKVQKSDLLLAIIHGVGPTGWRNRDARQAFLLRNAAGANAAVQPASNLRNSLANSKFPLRGDAISETFNGQAGLILWTGAKYAWAPQQ